MATDKIEFHIELKEATFFKVAKFFHQIRLSLIGKAICRIYKNKPWSKYRIIRDNIPGEWKYYYLYK